MLRIRLWVRAAAVSVVWFDASSALAQTPATAGRAVPEVQGDEVTVTSTVPLVYRATDSRVGALGKLPLVSTPFSVNVITQDLLVDQQASYLGDFLKNDPSATVGNVVISFANLRGFALGSDGYLLDGLTVGSLLLDGRTALPSFERIDILKGAGTFLTGLGGSASLGGSLNYIPKTPPETPVRDVGLIYNSQSQFGAEVDLGDRLGTDRQFGYRMNLGFRDGNTAVDGQTWKQGAASLVLDWRINPSLLLQGGLYYVDNDYKRIQPFFVGASNANGSPIIPIPDAPDTSKNLGPSWSVFEQNATIGWLRADWAFAPDWSVTLQYGGGQNNRPNDGTQDTRFGVMTSGSGDILLFASEERSRVDVQTGQALVHGKLVTGPVQHAITLGASGFEEKNYSTFVNAGVVPGNLYTANDPLQPPNVPLENLPYTGKTTSQGLLISDIMSFGERWSILLGGRQANVTTYDAAGTETPGGSISKFSPAVALMYKPTPHSLLYANYVQGLEPGGTAPEDTTNAGAIMPPLVTAQYEIGAKIETNRLTLTAAVFDMQKPLQFRDASNTWVQDGDQVHKGVELLVTGLLTRDLRIVTGMMFLNSEQQNSGNATTNGKQVPGVPQWTANFFGDYAIRTVPGLFVNAGAYYSGTQYFDLQNLQPIPAWIRFDIGARYETHIGGKRATFLFAVENVANRNYWASAIGGALTLGDPLTVKATARISF